MPKRYEKLTDISRELKIDKTKLKSKIKKYEEETGDTLTFQEGENKLVYLDIDKLSEMIPQLRKSDSVYELEKKINIIIYELNYINEALCVAGMRNRSKMDPVIKNLVKELDEKKYKEDEE